MPMTPDQFQIYECDWIGTFESAGKSRQECVDWMKSRPSRAKPRVRVKMGRSIVPLDEDHLVKCVIWEFNQCTPRHHH